MWKIFQDTQILQQAHDEIIATSRNTNAKWHRIRLFKSMSMVSQGLQEQAGSRIACDKSIQGWKMPGRQDQGQAFDDERTTNQV